MLFFLPLLNAVFESNDNVMIQTQDKCCSTFQKIYEMNCINYTTLISTHISRLENE